MVEPKLTLLKEASVNGGPYSAAETTLTDGATVSYRLKVTNTGASSAYGIVVTDKPPSALEAVTPTENAGYVTSNVAGEIAWKIPGPVAAGASVELGYSTKLVAVKTLKAGQAVDNNATIPAYFGVSEAERAEEHKEYLGKPIPYREYKGPSAEVKATVALPAISIEKTTGAAGFPPSANVEVDQAFTWRVVVKNTSSVAATKLKVADILPPNWEYVGGASFTKGGSLTPTEAGALETGRELTWSTSIELAAGASTILTYQAKPTVAAESNPGSGPTHPNKNTASATVLDVAGNAEDAEGPFAAGPASAQAVLLVPVLEVTKTPLKASVAAGEADSYTIVVHNSGAGVAREVLAEDTLPAGLIYEAKSATASPSAGFSEKSASATKVVWAIESIAPGASVEITVPVGTEASLASGTKLKNIVAVHATAAPAPVQAEGTITLTTSADLQATKTASVNPVTPGGEETYTISVLNEGPSVAREVKLSDPLPAGTTFKSADLGCSDVVGTVECVVGELAPNASAVYHVTVSVASSVTTKIVNTVEATSPTPDPEPNNNKASVEVGVAPEADLSLEKTAPETVITGEELTWTLTVKNKGPSDAKVVTVVDPLPVGANYLGSAPSQGLCKEVAGTLTCKLGPLAAGASATITITARVTAAPGALTNTATVSGEEPDPEPENNEASATTTVVEPPAVVKASDSPEATIGHRVTYTLTVTVPAQAVAYDQTVIDTLPDTLDFDEYVSATCTSGCTTPETTIVPKTYTPKVLGSAPATTSVAWYLGNVTAAPQARTIVLVYRASVRATHRNGGALVQAPAEIKNSATLYYNQTNKGSFEEATIPSPESFDQKTAPVSTSTKVVEPSLTLTKEASVNGAPFSGAPFTITASDTVSYRLQVKNTGASPAYTAAVTDTPPKGLVVVSIVANPAATETKAWSEADPEIAWQITGPLQPGETVTLEYSAKLAVKSVKDAQKLTNTATVPSYFGVSETERAEGHTEYEGKPILYREYKGPSAQLTATVALPVLEVTKTPLKASVAAGEEDSYTIVVHNSGTGVAGEVLAEDTLPKGMTYKAGSATASPPAGFSEKSASGSKVIWAIESIAPNTSVEITVPVVTEASLPSATKLTNTVAVHATAAPAPVEAEGTITLTTSADLEATKSIVSAGNAIPGKTITYEVTAINKGPSQANEVKLVDHLPAGLTYKSSSPAGCSEAAGVVTCAAGNLEPGHTAAFQIEVQLAPSLTGAISNTVTAESTETPGHPATPDPEPANNKATKEVAASPEADLELKKTALATVITGEELTWTLTAKNNGPSDAKGVTVVDPLPVGTEYVSSTPGTCKYEAGTLTCKLGPLAAKASAEITVTARVTAAPGALTNTATVSGEEPDPEPANNKASATTTVLEPPAVAKASDSSEATIGHRVTYTLTVTVPAQAVAFDQTVIDTLPDTLDFDEYVSATCTSGCTTPETTIVPKTYTPKVLGSAPSTTSVAWYLGNVTAAPQARTIVLVYRASVRATHRNGGALVQAPAEIKNSATLYYDQTEKIPFEEATIPSPESFDQKTPPVSTSTEVVEPALTLTKEASVDGGAFSSAPFTIAAGDSVNYRLQVKNTGASPAYDAAVTDTPPKGLVVVSIVANPAATETKAWSEADPEIAWQITGPLQPGETMTLEYSVKLAPNSVKDGQKLTNTATVPSYFGVAETERKEGKKNFAGEEILYREYNGPSAQLTATVALPVLEVTKTPAQASVLAGKEDSYTITVHNSGTGIAHEVKVLDTLPAGMTFEAGSATANPPTGFSEESVVGNVVTWKIASIGVREKVEITVPVGIEPSVETGSELTNEVAVTSTEQTTPVEAEGTIKVTTSADVEAKKSVLGPNSAVPGAQLTYVVAAKNNGGPSVARAVQLTDKLPAGVVFVSAQAGCTESAGTVTCEAGNLNPGQEASFQIVVSVLSGNSGSIANTVRAESTATPGHPATPDPEPANNEAHVEVPTLPSADLELVKTALTPEVHPGQQASFSLVVTNKGPSDAQEVKLLDTLPAGLAYVSAGGASCEAAGQAVTCTLGTMTAGSSVTVELTTQPAGLGSYTNTAVVSSTTPDPDTGNNSSEATVKVVPVPVVTPPAPPTAVTPPASGVSPTAAAMARTSVTLRKLVREHVVVPGGRLDYRLIVHNAGAQTAEGLKVCDNLPEQATVLNPGGGHLAGARICFTLKTLAAGHVHTFTLVLRADSNAHGRIVNRATVTGKNFAPAHARASTPVQKASLAPTRENHVTG